MTGYLLTDRFGRHREAFESITDRHGGSTRGDEHHHHHPDGRERALRVEHRAPARTVSVWVRNYRTVRTPLTLGLIAFAGALLVENLSVIYFYVSTGMLYSADGTARRALLLLRALELAALGFLTYVSMR